ncbi:TPA: hypothetical protein DCQ44_02165 [Candidatus Taylorbacteria bacterium]|nr:hypothetical protein [Candidatus Taylorbacteria bacterium]
MLKFLSVSMKIFFVLFFVICTAVSATLLYKVSGSWGLGVQCGLWSGFIMIVISQIGMTVDVIRPYRSKCQM